jgi:hypothetical protein
MREKSPVAAMAPGPISNDIAHCDAAFGTKQIKDAIMTYTALNIFTCRKR